MRPSTRVLIGLFGIGAAAIGLVAYAVMHAEEVPEPHLGVQREVFPDLDYRAAAPGSSLSRVYGTFGKRLESSSDGRARRCIYFSYDPALFDGALVILANGTVVENRWIAKGSVKPEQCSGLPAQMVDLRGWYAAAVAR
jgi:hypothetical protein